MTKTGTDSQHNFIEKLYSAIVDLLYRYKSHNNTNIPYINHLQNALNAW